MAKISVITPIYNAPEYLDRCLNSLISQSLQDIEYIWIDNGATDGCKNIIKKYVNKNVNLIVYNENIGYLGAIIEGIKKASAKYIAFCDSDDWVNNDYYERLYFDIKENDCDMVLCPFCFSYDKMNKNNKKKLNFYGITKKRETVFDALSHGSIWNGIFKKEIVDINFLDSLISKTSIFVDNLILISSIFNAKKINLTDSKYYNYYQRKNSTINHLTRKQMNLACKFIIQSLENNVKTFNSLENPVKLLSFLHRSLPLFTLDSQYIKKNTFLNQSKNIVRIICSNQKYYYPTVFNRLFSLSINKNLSKIRFRLCFVTITVKLFEI